MPVLDSKKSTYYATYLQRSKSKIKHKYVPKYSSLFQKCFDLIIFEQFEGRNPIHIILKNPYENPIIYQIENAIKAGGIVFSIAYQRALTSVKNQKAGNSQTLIKFYQSHRVRIMTIIGKN